MKSLNLNNRIFLHSGLHLKPFLLALIIFFGLFPSSLMAQFYCSSPKDHGMGYSTTIYSVKDNGNNSYSIVLQVENNGESNPNWKELNYYAVEAEPGTYSDMAYTYVYGNVSYNGINEGPKLGGWNKEGFRIASISGIGNGEAGIFRVSYTLSGGLQDQWVLAKTKSASLEVFFSKEDFWNVLNCNISGIYAMPGGGKLSDGTNKIGPELTALSVYVGVPVSNDVYEIIHDSITNTFYVVAEFTPVNGQYSTLLSDLTSSFNVVSVIEDIDNQIIAGRVPISLLSGLNSLASLASARPLYPVGINSGLITTSQGDISMRSDFARQIFQIPLADGSKRLLSGEGIKIGIISNSYNTKGDANDDVLKFELPGIGIQSDGSELPNPFNPVPVIVKREYPYGKTTDEGRAMMQIIHDIAPGAELVFRTGVLGAVDMVEGIKELSAEVDIIVDDITYITQPFFEDGIVAQAVDSVVDGGVSYFTSAGNFGDKSYSGIFNPGSGIISGISGKPHRFGTNISGEDYYQSVRVEGGVDVQNPAQYTIVLQWEDGSSFDATNTDLDIYLMNDNGSGVIGFNRVNTGGYAIEVLPFTVKETTNTNIVIVKASDNTATVNFKYVVFKGQLTIEEYLNGASTIVGHANAAGAMTTGAIRYDKTPAFDGILNIMSFSSVGGQVVGGENRNKPDFTAPNGVNTTVDLGSGDWEGDEDLQPNFFGTSASAPHAAAVAALLMDAKNAYYDTGLDPAELRAVLKNSAIGSGVYDPAYGNGFIQADAALLDLANSSPIISESIQVEGGIPGINPVRVTMSGSYLSDAAVVYFNGLPLETDVDLAEGTLQADIPVFNDLYPELNAYNPPKEGTNGKDGGLSNTIYFTKKPTIIGTLNGLSKAYGEDMPLANLSFEVFSIDGTSQTLEEAGFTVDKITRINAIQAENTADALSNVGTWPYYISQDEILNPASTAKSDTTDIEASLLANYNFAFVLGDLSIAKLDLTITPDDRTIEFGDPIANMTYRFDYDQTSMSSASSSRIQQELNDAYSRSVLTEITVMADNAFYADSTENGLVPNSFYITKNAYANAQALALVNAQALALVNLFPGMTMAELQLNAQALALVNARALALVNAQALALVNAQALALVNTQALALVNAQALALVNGEPLSNVNLNAQALALVNAKTLMNAQALALVNAEGFEGGNVNAQALALVNAQALALVNNGSDFELNAQALALVNAQALALVNAQALALVNAQALALVNAQALALVNLYPGKELEDLDEIEFATMNAQALALVNAQALALVNLYPGMEMSELNAQALALVNAQALALVNAQALALVNGEGLDLSLSNAQALALVNLYPEVTSLSELNAQALALVNAQALALVNAQALALVNAQALALVNAELTLEDLQSIENAQALALVNAQALALVNGQALALVNAQALALVNAQALALVNAQALALVNLYPGMEMSELNAQALALVNARALALVNAQALALVNQSEGQVNSESFSDVYNNNEDAIIILTVEDIEAMRANNNSIELVSLNILSGNTVTADGETHKIAPGAFMAKNFNVHYGLGNLSVNPVPIDFIIDDVVVSYDGNGHQLNLIPSYKERLDKDGNPYVISPASEPYTVTYIDSENKLVEGLPIHAGVYRVNIQVTDHNYILNNQPMATLTIDQAPVSFVFANTRQTYNGTALSVEGSPSVELSAGDFDIRYFYNNQYNLDAPINAGTYELDVIITNPNYKLASEGSSTNVFTIEKALASFTFANTTQTYNGAALEVGVTAISTPLLSSEGYELSYFYNGLENLIGPTDAGIYPVEVFISNPNYKIEGDSTASLTIEKYDLTVAADNLYKTYGEIDPVYTYQITEGGNLLGNDVFIGNLNREEGENSGNYAILQGDLSAGNNYEISFVPGIFTINKALVSIVFSNNSLIYNGAGQDITVSTEPAVASYDILYSADAGLSYSNSSPEDAGHYQVMLVINDNNYTANPESALSAFTINRAGLIISGDSKVINEGAPVPEFTFTYNGFFGLDDASSVFGSDGPAYTINYNPNSSGPGEYALEFTQAVSANYFVSSSGIYLYVNPDKPGTKAVVPSLDCVTVGNGGIYTAVFSYENKNNVPVWVLIGEDNLVTGGGENRDISQQAIKFEPGGGEWIATFDGSPMTWNVSSQDHGHKTSQAQVASSNSKNCNTNKSAEQELVSENIPVFYPNPVKEKLTIVMDTQNGIGDVRLFNLVGKEEFVSIHRVSDQIIELDMANLISGIYLVQVQLGDKTNVFRVIKQ